MTNWHYHYQATPKLFDLIQPISEAIRDSKHTSKTLIDYCRYTNYMLEGRYHNAAHMDEQTGMDYTELRTRIIQHKHETETDIMVATFLLNVLDTLKITYDSVEELRVKLEEFINQMHALLIKMRQEFPNNNITTTHTEITIAACRAYDGVPAWERIYG